MLLHYLVGSVLAGLLAVTGIPGPAPYISDGSPAMLSVPAAELGTEPPPPPQPVAPQDRDTVFTIAPTLTVGSSPPIGWYHFQVYQGSSLVTEGMSPFPSWNTALGGRMLQRGHDYTWTCRAFDHRGWSEFFSPRWSFRVDYPQSPPEPKLPQNNSVTWTNRPLLVVKPVAADARYRFQVFLGRTLVAESLEEMPFWRVSEPLASGELYEWTCRAEFPDDSTSFFTPYWRFEVADPDHSIQTNLDSTSAIRLQPGNAPHAGSTITARPSLFLEQLNLTTTHTGPARLEIFGADGRLVHTATITAGRFDWDGRDPAGRPVGPGIYICRLTTARGVESIRVTRAR